MSITVKTRKILWSKSGNRCAICKHEIVKKVEEPNSNFILGEECHIISSKKDGLRGKFLELEDYDNYDNLILLCANDHKLVDEYPETFTVDVLCSLKNNHESWIKQAIDKDIEEYHRTLNNIEYLERILTKAQIEKILDNAHFFFFDCSSINDDQSIEVSEFFDNLRDFSDLYSDIEMSNKAKYLLEYQNQIKNFEDKGIYIFGKELIREYKFVNIPKSEYKTSMFVAVDANGTSFIHNNKLPIKIPDDFSPRF